MIIEQTQDTCVRKLTVTEGKDLELMANLQHPSQMAAMMEGFVDMQLGSEYGMARMEFLLRLSCSTSGRARDDLKEIGTQTAQLASWLPGAPQK